MPTPAQPSAARPARRPPAGPVEGARQALLQIVTRLEDYQLALWRDQGLTLRQVVALVRIRDQEAVTVGQVAGYLAVSPSTATGLTERLVQRGLVLRRARPGDRRVVELGLTPAGLALVERVVDPGRTPLRTALRQLPPAEVAQLALLLPRLAERLRADEADVTDPRARPPAAGQVPG